MCTNRADHAENPVAEVHAGVPLVVFRERTEDEEIEHLLRELVAEDDEQEAAQPPDAGPGPVDPVQWPTQDLNPINEYTTEGYITMALSSAV